MWRMDIRGLLEPRLYQLKSRLYQLKEGMNKPAERNKFLFYLDGIAINAAYVLTTGIMISGYALHLTASDFLVALINSSANFSTIFSLVSFIIFERLSSRKKTLLAMNFISRTLIFLIVLLPLLVPDRGLMLAMLAILVILSDIIWGIYRVGWLVWIMDTVPVKQRSSFTYMRMFIIRIFMGLTTIAGGFVLDYFNKQYAGFVVIFIASYVLSITDIAILRHVDDIRYSAGNRNEINAQEFIQPVKAPDYRGFLLFVTAYYLLYTMSTSFTPVYLVRYLDFDYKFISAANVVAMVSMILGNSFWGKVEYRKGVNFVIAATAYVLAAELLFLSFLGSKTAFLLIVSSVVSGTGMGGFSVSLMTFRYKIMPETGKTLYEGWFYFAYGLGMLLAPFAGRTMLGILSGYEGKIYGLSGYQMVYFLSFAAMMVLLAIKFLRPSVLNKTGKINHTA